ncbi:MAG TPA: helix-turn-helix transcriptional regulator [Bacilli bacterium]|jgi:transcriptional regulator with XRE-family HTH domain|nr:helix-turn-helix domain-containing protein [Bacilli bacterium]HNZ77967.1 helix-turn-helix transcriptional regulator [Bacilli bacterium]HOD62143.1 helix-turn-helix transcriptional regulator [Bacilli bacterium]HOH62164.1 helix-turn-helix transcriptional regulator [Bacilli bacterium]HOR17793.1 helix-turn-helix transcriptional regulator [Bacilli bacterium]
MFTEEQIKENIAKNLIKYRKAHNLTQIQLAEKLNYSDKSISKWERQESIPDLVILSNIAKLYGISVQDLLANPKEKVKSPIRNNRVIITLMSFTGVWAIATTVYALLGIFAPNLTKSWLVFIYAIPLSLIDLVVFTKLWGNKWILFVAISLLSWSIPLAIYLSFDYDQLWLLFIVIIPLQILAILWFIPRKTKANKK